jgi:hypothetical protein
MIQHAGSIVSRMKEYGMHSEIWFLVRQGFFSLTFKQPEHEAINSHFSPCLDI